MCNISLALTIHTVSVLAEKLRKLDFFYNGFGYTVLLNTILSKNRFKNLFRRTNDFHSCIITVQQIFSCTHTWELMFQTVHWSVNKAVCWNRISVAFCFYFPWHYSYTSQYQPPVTLNITSEHMRNLIVEVKKSKMNLEEAIIKESLPQHELGLDWQFSWKAKCVSASCPKDVSSQTCPGLGVTESNNVNMTLEMCKSSSVFNSKLVLILKLFRSHQCHGCYTSIHCHQ